MNGKTMVLTPELDLNAVTIDVSLAQQVPYALSRYYLALPLGRDSDSVSVAMAYPENVKARQVLSRLLHARVVPVFSPANLLLPLLERIYCPENEKGGTILAWCGESEWETAVLTAASHLSETLHVSADVYSSVDLDLNEVFRLTTTGHYELVVMPAPAPPMLSIVLNRAATSLFFIRGEEQPAIRQILVVMRGFASDEQALDWLTPFACQQQAAITLMPLVNGSGCHWQPYHPQDSPAGQHLERCLQRLRDEGAAVNLKYRFGNAIEQVVNEVRGDAYDLLVLAAEAEGSFVAEVITAVNQHNVHRHRAIFILKPPVWPQQAV